MTEFEYSTQPDRNWWSALWGDPAETLDALGIDGGSLVDCCCGDGYFTVEAARRCRPTYAVDLDGDLLSKLDHRAYEAGVTIETVEGDARDLPELVPDPVDTVLLANTLHGVDDQTALAGAVRDTLVPGGRFVVTNWHDMRPMETTVLDEVRGPPKPLRMTPEQTRESVEPAGFDAVETVDLPPYHYGVVFERG